MGRVPENLCVQLLNGYEVERAAKQERRKVLCELLSARREKEQSVDECHASFTVRELGFKFREPSSL